MPDLPLPIAPLLPGARLWGNSLQFYRNPAELFVEGYRRHGPIFRVRIVGEEYTVLAGEEALAFFLEHGGLYFSRNRFFAPYARALGASQIPLGAPPSDQRALRRALRLGFSRQIAAPFLPEMAQAVQARASAIDPRRPVQAMEVASAILLDHYGLVLAGRPLGPHLPDARPFGHLSLG